ncbi:nucleotidyltransferase family protein [Thermodesulfatator atlanticus]|uniref:nucleotidyltransferase family protein n=1 Tax=Thermodesulfatator atlanticus TaxID=501497 RepID=UPI0004098133|nr:nucleotidyltransferase domain-containing protein [Thermodesulfatator atlanticus]
MKWPTKEKVWKALEKWALRLKKNENVCRIGVFGSYSRNDAGVGSDLDVVIILRQTDKPFYRRGTEFYPLDFPVPVDLLVYNEKEWQKMEKEGKRITKEVIWII